MLKTADEALYAVNALLVKQASVTSLSDLQSEVFCQCWLGLTYGEIAELRGYDTEYIKQVASQLWRQLSTVLEQKVTKKNLKTALNQYLHHQSDSGISVLQAPLKKNSHIKDWGDAPDSSFFYGRADELVTLNQWILEERCNLVTLLGMGGVGKTVLSVKVAQTYQSQYSYIIWRNLKDMPPLVDLLSDLLRILSRQQLAKLPSNSQQLIALTLKYLKTSECLIVLDNLESLLQTGENFGRFQVGYEDYGELLTRLGEVDFKSCIIITSRELPEEVAVLSGDFLPVRVLKLSGLDLNASQEILNAKGLAATVSETRDLMESYQGNPLALKIAATSIQDIFSGNIPEFLKQETITFNGIRRLLERQTRRLSKLEEQIIRWLAIGREPVPLEKLETNLVDLGSKMLLLEALEFLSRRSLIEKILPQSSQAQPSSFTLQPVVMEYITECLISEACADIVNQTFEILRDYSLAQVQAKDFVRDVQIRLILEPIKRSLTASFPDPHQLEIQLKTMLTLLQSKSSAWTAYAAGNLLNLLRLCQADFSELNLSGLTIRQADLRGLKLHHVNFANADLRTSLFSENLGSILALAYSPNGDLLAISNDDQIQFYQYPQYQKVLTLVSRQKVVIWTIAFSDNGHFLASGSVNRVIEIWDIRTGKYLRALQGHQGTILSVIFKPQDPATDKRDFVLASASQDGSVKLWNSHTGECQQTLQEENQPARSVTFSADGIQLAIGYFNGRISILNLITKTKQWLPSKGESLEFPVVFHPNNTILAAGYGDGNIHLWDVSSQQVKLTLQGHTTQVFSLKFSTDGHTLNLIGNSGLY